MTDSATTKHETTGLENSTFRQSESHLVKKHNFCILTIDT